jgi:hypothetical protein
MFTTGAANVMGKVGDCPGPRVPRSCTCAYPIAFYPHTFGVVCLIRLLLSETGKNEDRIEEVFEKVCGQ